MFTIRPEQLDAFRAAEWRKTVALLAAHARRFAPGCEAMGEDALLLLIQRARAECLSAGLRSAQAIACWVEMKLTFGAGATTDGSLPWLEPLLRDTAAQPERVRVDCLRRAAEAWRTATPWAAEKAPP